MFKFSGPRPDLDPDVVAALDDAIDLNDPDNILEDDFILKVIMKCGKYSIVFLITNLFALNNL